MSDSELLLQLFGDFVGVALEYLENGSIANADADQLERLRRFSELAKTSGNYYNPTTEKPQKLYKRGL